MRTSSIGGWIRYAAVALLAAVAAAFGTVTVIARQKAHEMITHPLARRPPVNETPLEHGMGYVDLTVQSEGGCELVGWYVPSTNGAAIILQHGYKANRVAMLEEAEILNRHGYGVLLTTVRAHDLSEGELISFGYHEVNDLEAWYERLLMMEDVDPNRIGALGNSLGGSMVLQLASQNPGIRAVVAHSPFSSIDDTIETSVEAIAGLPAFPFAPLMIFWAEQELGFDSAEIDAKLWIAEISPRPVLILQGGQDDTVSQDSGRLLYEAAGDPKELWFEPEAGHAAFDLEMPEVFERRVVGFFDRYLPGD